MNNAKEKLSFLLENIYLSTNALALALLGHKNNIVAELGDIDMDILSKNLEFLFPVLDNMCVSCSRNDNPFLFNLIKKNNISIVCARLTASFTIVIVYAKSVSVNSILDELEILIKKLSVMLAELKKGASNVLY